jgi:hypothetical protein
VENQQAFEQPPTAVNVTVPRPRQSAPREYLTEREVERLMKAAADNAGVIGTRLPSSSPTGTACEPQS